MPLTHLILPVNHSSSPVIDRLLRSAQLTRRPSQHLQHDRAADTLYQLTPVLLSACPLSALDDHTLLIGSDRLQVPLGRLPSAEQHAVVRASDHYAHYPDLPALSRHLAAPGITRERAFQAIDAVVQRGRQSTRQVDLTVPDPLFQAQWNTSSLVFQQLGHHWFVVLYFDLRCLRPNAISRTTEFALDLGAMPLVYASTSDDRRFTTARCAMPLRGLRRNLPTSHQDVLDRVITAWYRRELQQVSERLCRDARIVYVEDLNYTDMYGRFVQAARRYGVLDFHESWLHTRLRITGIPMEKIDATGTSQRCSFCPGHPYGHRAGDQFTCRHCGRTLNAHWNATRNILRLGREKAPLWGTVTAV